MEKIEREKKKRAKEVDRKLGKKDYGNRNKTNKRRINEGIKITR